MSDELTQDYVWNDELLKSMEEDFKLSDAGQGFHRIGKTDVGFTRFIKWTTKADNKREAIEITQAEFLKVPPGQRGFDLTVTVNIAEFDERAKNEGWNYQRRIGFKSDDWFKIFVPSLEAAFGEKSMDAGHYLATLTKLRGVYADWQDVPQAPRKGKVPTNEATGKPYTTAKLFKLFANRDEAQVAYNELHQASENGTAPSEDNYPTMWKGYTYSEGGFLAKVAELLQTDMPIAELCASTFLTANGEPATTSAGGKADVKAILMQAYGQIDAPEPLKAGVLAKINSL